ncbi:MAG: DUF5721 family protein, partial [Eubacteriales bacterium]|nr:DUF5721 family protein [Eubacteriales bacterium]
MRAFQIKETGNFMTKLLSGGTFDSFLLEEASLHMQVAWHLDGHLNMDFFDDEEKKEQDLTGRTLVPWSEVRSHLRSLLLGRKAPSSLTIVLHYPDGLMQKALKDAALSYLADSTGAMVLTVRFDGTGVTLVSGLSLKSFTLDKQADSLWDDILQA